MSGTGVAGCHSRETIGRCSSPTEEDRQRQLLTRRITSFRQVGELYRRDQEVHRQRLLAGSELAAQLRSIGFRVRILRGYGPLRSAGATSACWHASCDAADTCSKRTVESVLAFDPKESLPGLREHHILGTRSRLVTSQNRDAWAFRRLGQGWRWRRMFSV